MTTPQKAKHSPLPWDMDVPNIDSGSISLNSGNAWVASAHFNTHKTTEGYFPSFQEGKANAKFICLAVNNHDALVEALGECYDYIKDVRDEELLKKMDALISKIETES